jgi:hypothetical protein
MSAALNMLPEVRDLLDRQAITDKLNRYCRAVDRLDIPLGHTVFHADSHADYGSLYRGDGRGVIDLICRSHLETLNHSHQICNTIISLQRDHGNEHAGSEAYFHSATRLMMDGKLTQIRVWGRYLDTWSKRGGEWAIDRRLVVFDFDELREITRTMRGDEGRRDAGDPSYQVLRTIP